MYLKYLSTCYISLLGTNLWYNRHYFRFIAIFIVYIAFVNHSQIMLAFTGFELKVNISRGYRFILFSYTSNLVLLVGSQHYAFINPLEVYCSSIYISLCVKQLFCPFIVLSGPWINKECNACTVVYYSWAHIV